MSQDVGIFISAPGSDASMGSAGLAKAKTLMNTTNPFIKIDTKNSKGFQTITLIITTNPPEPLPGNATYTTLYQFAHGYTYVPSLETLFYVSVPPGAPYNGFTQTYFQDKGGLGGANIADSATLYAVADKTNVYFICLKTNGTGAGTLLTGTTVQITPHVFVEDIGV